MWIKLTQTIIQWRALLNITSRVSVTIDGVWINGFIDHLHYSELQAITAPPLIFHNSQITTVPAKPFPASCVFTSRFLQQLPTVESLQLHALRSCLHSLPYWTQLSPDLPIAVLTNCPAYNISARTTQKTPFFYCCVRVCWGRYLITVAIYRVTA
jgi:hypothetical protein